jgi:hypothetical protein
MQGYDMAKRSKSSSSPSTTQLAREAAKARNQANKLRDKLRRAKKRAREAEERLARKLREKEQRQAKNFAKRVFRSAVAKLKRVGLVSKRVDARKAQPTSKPLKEKISKFEKVLEGKERSFRVSDKASREALKEQGYTVQGDRVILANTMAYRKGKVRVTQRSTTQSKPIQSLRLGRNFDKQIKEAFKGLKDDEYIAFNVEGHNSLSIYQVPEALISDLMKYNLEKRGVTFIRVFKVEDAPQYIQQRRIESNAVEKARRARVNARKKQAKSVIRTARGR